MGARPRARQGALRPFLTGAGEGGAPAQSDSGGASFLGQVALLPASSLARQCSAKPGHCIQLLSLF